MHTTGIGDHEETNHFKSNLQSSEDRSGSVSVSEEYNAN